MIVHDELEKWQKDMIMFYYRTTGHSGVAVLNIMIWRWVGEREKKLSALLFTDSTSQISVSAVVYSHKKCTLSFSNVCIVRQNFLILTRSLQTQWTSVLPTVSISTVRAHGYWSRMFLLSWNSTVLAYVLPVTSILEHKGYKL